MAQIVPRVRTPWTVRQIVDGLITAEHPDRWTAAAQLAQISLETGWGGGGCWNGNVGNITAAPSLYAGQAWEPPWVKDKTHPVHAMWAAGRAPSLFRAYPNVEAGVADYVASLRRYFPEILEAYRYQDPFTLFKAIRQHYMPDAMSTKREADSFCNFRMLIQKALEQPEILALEEAPPAPKA